MHQSPQVQTTMIKKTEKKVNKKTLNKQLKMLVNFNIVVKKVNIVIGYITFGIAQIEIY